MITAGNSTITSDAHALKLRDQNLLSEVLGYETHEIAGTASGTDVHTVDGTHFIDFTGGIAVHACGHCHPDVVKAVQEQAARILHTSDVMLHAPELEMAAFLRDKLSQAMPGSPKDWQFLFLNGGSESVDATAKLAVKASGRSQFIAFDGAFHGRTMFATALSRSKSLHWKGYEPVISTIRQFIHHAPSTRGDGAAAIAGVEAIIAEHGGENIAAMYFEAEQGEGGYFPMTPATAQKLREITRKHGILMIADEIQSGMGRTGRWFGFEHLGIEPDMVLFGKAVGGGLPLAGFAASTALMEKWAHGEHGTTFGGNPIACAAGLAALRVIEREGLVANAARLGEKIKARLTPLVGRHGIVDVRGHGLMLAIEMRDASGAPDYARCEAVKHEARSKGLLFMTCGAKTGGANDTAAIRLIPPLSTTDAVADTAIDIFTEALSAKL